MLRNTRPSVTVGRMYRCMAGVGVTCESLGSNEVSAQEKASQAFGYRVEEPNSIRHQELAGSIISVLIASLETSQLNSVKAG